MVGQAREGVSHRSVQCDDLDLTAFMGVSAPLGRFYPGRRDVVRLVQTFQQMLRQDCPFRVSQLHGSGFNQFQPVNFHITLLSAQEPVKFKWNKAHPSTAG
jgi:hypothetical protein